MKSTEDLNDSEKMDSFVRVLTCDAGDSAVFELKEIALSDKNGLSCVVVKLQMKASTPMMKEKVKEKPYFWGEDEHLEFVALFLEHGRKWKTIAQHMEGRSTMQCRTHGQKYLLAIRQLQTQIELVLAEKAEADQNFC